MTALASSIAITVPQAALAPGITVHPVTPADYAEIARLHDATFGPGALTRTAYRIREGQPFHSPFCRITRDAGRLIAAIRLTPIRIGANGRALMLGPLAVAASHANQGHARRLIRDALEAAQRAGISLVILVGDAPYYGKHGFVPVPPGQIAMPGPVDPARLLAFELTIGALAATRGVITASS